MENTKIKTWVKTAMFASLVTVSTILIHIPIPSVGGYIHLGDGAALAAVYSLGTGYGALAGAFGAALADLLCGYAVFVPGTFVVRLAAGLCAGILLRAWRHKNGALGRIAAGLAGESVMVAGYFVYEAVFLGYGLGAAAEIVPNVFQAIAGVAVASAVMSVMPKKS